MRARATVVSLLLLSVACDSRPPGDCCFLGGQSGVRVVNAYTTPVDVLIDGSVAASAVSPGGISTLVPSLGTHTLSLRPAGSASTGSAQSITTAVGVLTTLAAFRQSDGTLSSAALDDTSDVVPIGATKVRVLHLAPNAGTLQVYRTQPDFATPTAWQTPFNYQTDLSSLGAPFYQSTVGTWEIRIWQTPADASGWDTAPVRVTVPLASGEKKTVLILDQVGGGFRVQLI